MMKSSLWLYILGIVVGGVAFVGALYALAFGLLWMSHLIEGVTPLNGSGARGATVAMVMGAGYGFILYLIRSAAR